MTISRSHSMQSLNSLMRGIHVRSVTSSRHRLPKRSWRCLLESEGTGSCKRIREERHAVDSVHGNVSNRDRWRELRSVHGVRSSNTCSGKQCAHAKRPEAVAYKVNQLTNLLYCVSLSGVSYHGVVHLLLLVGLSGPDAMKICFSSMSYACLLAKRIKSSFPGSCDALAVDHLR